MIELIIAFLLSIGWLTNDPNANTKIVSEDSNKIGVVSTDDVGTRMITITYDPETGTFTISE